MDYRSSARVRVTTRVMLKVTTRAADTSSSVYDLGCIGDISRPTARVKVPNRARVKAPNTARDTTMSIL